MMTLASPVWVFLRSVALGAMVLTLIALTQAGADEASKFEASQKIPPMEFFIAKGGPNACGVGCDSWIAAEGRIARDGLGADGRFEEGTTARFTSLLSRLGGRKLPIFFHSPGGDIIESLALGRALRAWEIRAGVATTVPANCSANDAEDCRKLIREHPETEARLWSEGAQCSSGCAYAILGAATREIGPTAKVGVHSFFVNPGATEVQRARTMTTTEERIDRYLADMGIDLELHRIASATGIETIHVLTRSELYDLRIDRREIFDSGWTLGNIDSRKGFMVFAAADAKTGVVGREKSTSFKRIDLVIACYRPRRSYLVVVSQPLSAATVRTKDDIRVSAGAVGVTLDGDKSLLTTASNSTFQVWRELVGKSLLETLLASPTIKVAMRQRRSEARRSAAEDPPPEFLFTNVRGPEALKAIVSRCARQR